MLLVDGRMCDNVSLNTAIDTFRVNIHPEQFQTFDMAHTISCAY
jgi:hypothetical protein